jgi:hypothetical protein
MLSNGISISFSGHGHIEGIYSISKKDYSQMEFTTYNLGPFPQAIIGPAIAKGKKKNGIIIFDTTELLVDCIEL